MKNFKNFRKFLENLEKFRKINSYFIFNKYYCLNYFNFYWRNSNLFCKIQNYFYIVGITNNG